MMHVAAGGLRAAAPNGPICIFAPWKTPQNPLLPLDVAGDVPGYKRYQQRRHVLKKLVGLQETCAEARGKN